MPRRSQFAGPAETWLKRHAAGKAVSTKEFWGGLSKEHPDLTTPSEGRKTPKATCMRDLRKDPAFELGQGRIGLTTSQAKAKASKLQPERAVMMGSGGGESGDEYPQQRK